MKLIGPKKTERILSRYNAWIHAVSERYGVPASAIKAISKHIQGGGGGKPTMAQAGGKNPDGIDAALAAAREMLTPKA